jgi:acyl-CoA reductase-like NAD-dependent aldehyde dehydrogenase
MKERTEMAYEGRLFIGGEFVDAQSGKTFATVDPATEELICDVAFADTADIDAAVAAAQTAAAAWIALEPSDRGRILYAMADAIEEAGDELAALDAIDGGRLVSDCAEDTQAASALFRYFGGLADKVQGTTIPVQNDKFCFTRREPYGVIAAITAWNYPLYNACAKLAPILATGNSCILKPAEETPLTAIRLAGILEGVDDAPPGLVNVVNGPGEVTGAAMSAHMRLPKLSFTGGTETGRKILVASAESNLKSVTLELGGKAPFIIFADADIDTALDAITFSVFFNQGQTCTAGTRLLVDASVRERVISGLVERVSRINVGLPTSDGVSVGPLISRTQYDKVLSYMEAARTDGVTCLVGGGRPAGLGTGFYLEPTIYLDPEPDSPLYRDEIFGPVLVLNTFDSDEEAATMANDTSYGLSASIWTNDVRRLHTMAQSVSAGVVWCNTTFTEHPAAPLGGYKQSGFGREFGQSAIEEYTQLKTVWIDLSGEFEQWV